MRAFILCALLAMATTVSCQSATCNTAYTALETNANVTTARAFVSETGCQELNFNDTQCTQPTTDVYSCACINTLENTTAWEAAVTQNDGRACYLKFDFTLIGSLAVDNVTTRVVQLTANQTNVEFLSIPNNCTNDDLKAKAGSFVTQAVNKLTTTAASFQKTNVTWTSGSVTISACTTTVTESRTFGGATAAPTTAAPTVPGTTTQPPTGSSSTGKSGASIIASSFTLVASLIAAVTILA